jgi:glyoxalase family protein
MKLEGIHHITCITSDGQSNVDFYAGVMGLRLVKKTVNQDDPTVYHLFFADEKGDAGSDLTFFEFPGVPRGRAGAGEVHTIIWRVGSEEALDFWEERLRGPPRPPPPPPRRASTSRTPRGSATSCWSPTSRTSR